MPHLTGNLTTVTKTEQLADLSWFLGSLGGS